MIRANINRYGLMLFLFFSLILLLPVQLQSYSIEPIYGKSGMVVTASKLATDIGVEILEQGGNAYDAAIGVAFTLAVTYPSAGNIGGGGFMMIRDAESSKVYALDYREKAPLRIKESLYYDKNGKIDFDILKLGYLAAGVPGTVKGMWEAHRRFGSIEWKELIKPAIRLARKGFPVTHRMAKSLNKRGEYFKRFPASRIFLKADKSDWIRGDMLIQPDLADTLQRIANEGESDFYSGTTARILVQSIRENGGIISMKDLSDYSVRWRQPLIFKSIDYTVYLMPLPSSGGIALIQVLNILRYFGFHQMQYGSFDYYHTLSEALKLAFRNRALFLGDPDFQSIPLKQLIDEKYLKSLAKMIKRDRTLDLTADYDLKKSYAESEQTTHFSIIDQWGNAVSNTYTLNSGYGSRAVAEGTGILLNNQMDDFSVGLNLPNQYGLVGNKKNGIEPGKRMLSSMTPAIITQMDNVIALGAPGGPKIITAVLQVIMNRMNNGMNLHESVLAPRVHHQWRPNVLYIEKYGFSPELIKNLEERGHIIEVYDYMGCVNAAGYNFKEKIFHGVADPRLEGVARGIMMVE